MLERITEAILPEGAHLYDVVPLFYLYKLSFRQDDSRKMANFRRK